MQLNISALHGDISEATRAKIAQKLEKIQRFFERLTAIEATVDLSKSDEPEISVVVKCEHKHDISASHRSKDMFGSVDQVVAKLEQQVKKHKEKLQEHNKN
ncbi:ribosomal subunit interface protein [Planctomycetales bacterium]|nr:ribosomal subunit interface protein [Planctomycetales bacterium]